MDDVPAQDRAALKARQIRRYAMRGGPRRRLGKANGCVAPSMSRMAGLRVFRPKHVRRTSAAVSRPWRWNRTLSLANSIRLKPVLHRSEDAGMMRFGKPHGEPINCS